MKPVEHKLAEVYSQVERGADKYPTGLIKLLLSRIKECQDVVTTLTKKLSHLTARTEPVYEQLVSVRRQITAAGARPKVSITGSKRDPKVGPRAHALLVGPS